MSVYLSRNKAYYASNERISYLDKLFKFMDNKTLYQRNIDYVNLLDMVYKKIQTDKEVAKEFNDNPYSFGFLQASLLYGYDDNIVYNSHNGINPCTSRKMKIFVNLVEEFYSWIFKDKNSSFHKLNQREQEQIKWLYGSCALSFTYSVATYICEIPLKYEDNRKLKKYHDERILPIYKNNEEFLGKAVTMDEFVAFAKLENLLKKRNQKNQKINTKDK